MGLVGVSIQPLGASLPTDAARPFPALGEMRRRGGQGTPAGCNPPGRALFVSPKRVSPEVSRVSP